MLQCYEYPRSAFQTNIQGTFNVLEVCVVQGVKRLVFSSSASVYGDALEEPMTEAHPFNNRTFYGATKIAGKAMATAYHHRYGLPFLGLRYMNVYGPRQDYRGAYIAVIMKMLDALDKGQPMTLYGDGSRAYDFVYAEDCAAANICAMKEDTVDEMNIIMWVLGNAPVFLELAKEIQKVTGTSNNIQFLPQGTTFVKNRIGCPKKAAEQIAFKAEVV
ncbi:NAD-dependent epimerase/dehydratase family protein [Coxiella endosymbiont of Ornithodoros amblus]|uniref:NAD-dependent epimerase/dehydratase family protein n=1 Tax=Coxiella endosymbiont of Ornithodoros amblus TaxID=1656166 RepID=UPI00244E55F9|nr:NAD-dependent epimerase/dehydratase family protein [Coxiella endosymbiont of Ornithodoros amblus]